MAFEDKINDWTEIVKVIDLFKCIIIWFVISYSISANAAILNVPDDYLAIQDAMNAAASGDTVLVAPGHYHGQLIMTEEKDLCLASNWLFSGDSLDMASTILDGDYLGTLLWIESENSNFELAGFVMQGGLGNTEQYLGGAIGSHNCEKLRFWGLHFRDNYSSAPGALYRPNFPADSIFISDIFIGENWDNEIGFSFQQLALVYSYDFLSISNVVARNLSSPCGLLTAYTHNQDSKFYFSNITVENCPNLESTAIIANNYNGGKLYANNITLKNVTTTGSGLVLGGDEARIKNIIIEECNLDDYCSNSSGLLSLSAPDSLFADSLIFRNNKSRSGYCAGNFATGNYGEIRNLLMEDNQAGGLGDGDLDCTQGSHLSISGCNLYDSKFINNTSILGAIGDNLNSSVEGGILRFRIMHAPSNDSLKMVNCEFIGNHVEERDQGNDFYENLGRVIYFTAAQTLPHDDWLVMRDVTFINNTLSHPLPDSGDRVSFTVRCSSMYNNVMMDNVVMRDCDDGGFFFDGTIDKYDIRNVEITNVKRAGLLLASSSGNDAHVRNILIDEVIQEDCFVSYPYGFLSQQAFVLNLGGDDDDASALVENITISNCDVPVLLKVETDSVNPIIINSSLMINNQFEYFNHPMDDDTQPEFHYCLLDDDDVIGENNLFALDPLFDTEIGSPILSIDSPCIDAGTPDTLFNDLEDLANPGFALWPSLGSLRNDIGFTGGQGAYVPEFVGVDQQQRQSLKTRPQTAKLGTAFPNPFNPVTQIPYHLPKPAEVTISVYDLLGRQIAVLKQGIVPAGEHRVLFDGSALASGMYFVKLHAGGQVDISKVLLVK
jgi:hypothetical protein